jgi:hypothetical protein
MLPFMPFFFYYTLVGVEWVTRSLTGRQRNVPVLALTAIILGAYSCVYYTSISFGPFSTGPHGADYRAIHDDVSVLTAKTAVVMTQQPEWSYLLTLRRTVATPGASCCSDQAGRAEVLRRAAAAGVSYVLVRHHRRERVGFYSLNAWDQTDAPEFQAWVTSAPTLFRELARRGHYRLYSFEHVED